jgi:hypothetical protein
MEEHALSILRKYKWEATHVAILLGVITALGLVTHLAGTRPTTVDPPNTSVPLGLRPRSADSAPISVHASPAKAVLPSPINPREVVVGPNGINNRYVLLSVDRKPLSPTEDEVTVRIHVASLATENLVSPFASDMLEIQSPEFESIIPRSAFHLAMTGGENLDKDVAFAIPNGLNLRKAALHIHYYNDRKQIPLSLARSE